MNVALISVDANPLSRSGDGDECAQSVMVDGLGHALGALGHRVTIYARRDDPSLPDRVQLDNDVAVAYLRAGAPTALDAAARAAAVDAFGAALAARWQADRPHAVHAFGERSGAAVLAARAGKAEPRFVQTLYSPVVAARTAEPADRQTVCARAASRILATSSSQVFALLGLGVSPSAIKFVPCGVDLRFFAPSRNVVRRPRELLRVATLSGLRVQDGVADVIEALARVPGVELVAGGGRREAGGRAGDADAARLYALAQSLGVADRVHLRGHIEREEVPRFLASADIVVCASHEDAMGMVALEAMACGVPVIVSSVGGLVDVVADGMTGIHVPPRSPRQLAYALEALANDPVRRERLGRLGIERTTARYGWPRIAGETAEIYRSVAATAPRLTSQRRA